ncbi:MAG: PfkB family carbohydrate kinase [Schumannella sp.]
MAVSDVVKASDEDLAWLYPRLSIAEVLSRWAAAGPRLVVVTRGSEGADALADGAALHVDVPRVAVADTIGAGDSFMAGLLAALLELGFGDPSRALEFAARCAAVTVSRPGADPPWAREVGAPGGSPS